MAAVIAPEHPASPDATAPIAELDVHLTPLYPSRASHTQPFELSSASN